MTNRPCMGGWCEIRESCPDYEPNGLKPAERLCAPGADGVLRLSPQGVRFTRSVVRLERRARREAWARLAA
jgi:hypothetical protein